MSEYLSRMTKRMKWTLGILLVALCVVVMVGRSSMAQSWKSTGKGDANGGGAAAGSAAEIAIDVKKAFRPKNDPRDIFSHPPEWYMAHWPAKQGQMMRWSSKVDRYVIGQLKDGIHVWKSDEGINLGEIEYRDGVPFNGMIFIQGAADFRMIHQYENGEGSDAMNFNSVDGTWEVMSINRDGKNTYHR